MSTPTEIERVTEILTSCRKGSMDNKQYEATVKHNLTTYAQKVAEEEVEKYIKITKAELLSCVVGYSPEGNYLKVAADSPLFDPILPTK